jgi:hypothetical protein
MWQRCKRGKLRSDEKIISCQPPIFLAPFKKFQQSVYSKKKKEIVNDNQHSQK